MPNFPNEIILINIHMDPTKMSHKFGETYVDFNQ